MITMWIILGAAAAAMLTWRLHKASATLDRILREETREGLTRRDDGSEAETLPASHHR